MSFFAGKNHPPKHGARMGVLIPQEFPCENQDMEIAPRVVSLLWERESSSYVLNWDAKGGTLLVF